MTKATKPPKALKPRPETLETRIYDILKTETFEADAIALSVINENAHNDPFAAFLAWKIYEKNDFKPLRRLRTQADAEKADAYCLTAAELMHPEALFFQARKFLTAGQHDEALKMAQQISESKLIKQIDPESKTKLTALASELISQIEDEIASASRRGAGKTDISKLKPAEAYNRALEIINKVEVGTDDQTQVRELLIHASKGGIFQASKMMTKLKIKA